MILGFVILYMLLSVGIGLVAARRVHTAKDFAVAGRSLPLPIVIATVFATWFGAETVFGISATFVKEGLHGVVADPFGSSLCLILAGLFFARRLYRLNLLTIGDYYRLRYNRTVEVLCTLCIVASYLGWVAAQIKALGLVFNVVTDDDAGLDPAAGRVPTHHLSQGRADCGARVGAGWHAVLSVRLRADVSALLGNAGGPTDVRCAAPQGPATSAADADSAAHAGL